MRILKVMRIRGESRKIYERPHVPKKGIFRRWWQKKYEKLTLLNKVVCLRENYFFPECHEKIGFFNPTNALQNIIRLYSIPILRYRIISSWTSLPHLYTWILRYRIVRTRWTCFPSLWNQKVFFKNFILNPPVPDSTRGEPVFPRSGNTMDNQK